MATCIVSGTFNSPQGSAVSGATVRFNTQTPFLDASGNLVVPKEITTTTATDGTWSLTIAQSVTGNLTLDLNQTSLSPVTKYTFSLVIPASASATFAQVWIDSPNYTGQVANFPLSFSMITGQLGITQLPALANTKVWVGDSSAQATATATTGTGSVVRSAAPSLTGAVTTSGTLGIGPAGLVSGSQVSISAATNCVTKMVSGVAGGEQSLIFQNSASSGNFNYKIASNSSVASKLELSVSSAADGSTYSTHAMYVSSDGTITLPAAGTALTVTNNALISGNLTVSGTITGSSSGNLTLATPHNHGVLLSGSANATTAITPDASTSKVLVSGGSSADPAWSLLTNSNLSGSAAITNANLATMAANTVKANSTGVSATPTDVGLVSTNTASTAVLRDSSGNFSAGTITAALTGTASGNTTYTPANHGVVLSGSTNVMTVVAPDASTTKVLVSGGSSADPTWSSISGAMLPNPSSSSLGGIQSAAAVTHQWINSISTSGVPALSQPAFSDISGSVAASQLPNPTASTLGGVESYAAVTNQWINTISTSGVPSSTQPAFSNISGSVAAGQMPALTGDVTSSAGTVATTVSKIQSTTVSGTTGTGNVVFSASPTVTGTPLFSGSGSGTTGLQASTTASGTLTLPAATDTLVGKATTDTLTNKSISVGGTNDIGGTAISGVTGTTNVVFSGSPTISSPTLSGGTTTVSGSANTKLLISSTGAAAQNLNVEFRDTNAGNTQANWIIGDNLTTNGFFEIIPSTAAAGTTYTNPALKLASTGAVTVPGTLTSTGLFTPTAGVKGTTTNDNATALNVGEYIESLISTPTSVPGATTAYGDGTSISLTAGDWDVSGIITLILNGATFVSGAFGISTTSGNSSTGLVDGVNFAWIQAPTSTLNRSMSIPPYRISVASTTTVYLKIVSTFTVASPQFQARLSARRMR